MLWSWLLHNAALDLIVFHYSIKCNIAERNVRLSRGTDREREREKAIVPVNACKSRPHLVATTNFTLEADYCSLLFV